METLAMLKSKMRVKRKESLLLLGVHNLIFHKLKKYWFLLVKSTRTTKRWIASWCTKFPNKSDPTGCGDHAMTLKSLCSQALQTDKTLYPHVLHLDARWEFSKKSFIETRAQLLLIRATPCCDVSCCKCNWKRWSSYPHLIASYYLSLDKKF